MRKACWSLLSEPPASQNSQSDKARPEEQHRSRFGNFANPHRLPTLVGPSKDSRNDTDASGPQFRTDLASGRRVNLGGRDPSEVAEARDTAGDQPRVCRKINVRRSWTPQG